VTVAETSDHDINPAIYGANFPDAPPLQGTLDRYGYSAVRWGGNAREVYNPFTRTTNLGSDWYFVNRLVLPSADDWLSLIPTDVQKLLTVPSLDWVADGSAGWLYSVEKYGDQQEVAPDNDDAGNGLLPDGTPITWNDPTDAAAPWTTKDASDWLTAIP